MHCVFSCSDSCLYWCLAYICEGISALRIYIAVTSPYPWDQGVTSTLTSSADLSRHFTQQQHSNSLEPVSGPIIVRFEFCLKRWIRSWALKILREFCSIHIANLTSTNPYLVPVLFQLQASSVVRACFWPGSLSIYAVLEATIFHFLLSLSKNLFSDFQLFVMGISPRILRAILRREWHTPRVIF